MGARLWSLAIVGCLIALPYLLYTVFGDFMPMQRTEYAALAVAWAVVPYCLVQALRGYFGDRS